MARPELDLLGCCLVSLYFRCDILAPIPVEETLVTLNWKYFSQPLHMLINRSNQIICFDQPIKRLSRMCL